MLLFCPSCSNVLTVSSTPVKIPTAGGLDNIVETNRLECQTCPYEYLLNRNVFERKVFKRKEKEDVFGGPGQWDNADKMKTQCPKNGCDGEEAAFFQMQIRSADEPMTMFYKCMTCGNSWREN